MASGFPIGSESQRRIRPGEWYAVRDVFLILDISQADLQKAIANNHLAATKVGATYLMKGSDVLAWLDNGAPIEADQAKSIADRQKSIAETIRKKSRPAGGPAAAAQSTNAASGSPARSLQQSSFQKRSFSVESALKEFEGKVNALVHSGKSRTRAASMVARTDPDLHRRVVQEANRDRPAAMRQSPFGRDAAAP